MELDRADVLRRVVEDLVDPGTAVDISIDPDHPWMHRALLTSADGLRRVSLRTDGHRSAADVLDLGVSAMLFDEVDDPEYSEAMVRALALVARAHLRGEGRLESRRGLFRTHQVLVVEVGGETWELGRRYSRDHHPDRDH